MTTRQFDPVFSAGLRNELEALADTNEEAVRPPSAVRVLLHRPQLWVSLVTALVLVAATVGVLRVTTHQESVPAGHARVSDPLSQITDPKYPDFVARSVLTLLHTSGVGPATSSVTVPPGVSSVRAYIRCAPAATFRITIEKFVSSGCDATSQGGFGDVPITAGAHAVDVSVPKEVAWRLVVIATPTPSVDWNVAKGLLPYPTDAGTTGETLVGRARSSTSKRVVGKLTAPVHALEVLTTCQGSGTLVVHTSDGTTSGAASEAPDTNVCRPGAPQQFRYGINEEGGMEHDGTLHFSVEPVGDVTWTVSFYDEG